MYRNLGIGLVAIAGAVILAFLASYSPLATFGLAFAVPVFWLTMSSPTTLLYAALASVALGQLGRIPPLQGGAPLLADGFLAGLFLSWLVWTIWKRRPIITTTGHLAWYGFLLVGLVSLLLSPYGLDRGELLTALGYWFRLVIYSSLFWILPSIFEKPSELRKAYRIVTWTGVAVLVLGAIQLAVLPDIGILSIYGWDPHVGRYVSTFLDPNYLGGYLAILIAFYFAQARGSHNTWMWILLAATFVAGVLTYSRSGYLALAVVTLLIGLRFSWKLLLLVLVCVVPLAMSIPRVAERVRGGFSIDSTSQARIDSWERALTISSHHLILGVGYNSYDVAQKRLNIVSPLSESHASGGSDSSILNVLATTGVLGFTLFAISGFAFLRDALLLLRKKMKNERRIAAYVVLFAVPALLVNALFVNALFYPLILVTMTFFIGAMYVGDEESPSAP